MENQVRTLLMENLYDDAILLAINEENNFIMCLLMTNKKFSGTYVKKQYQHSSFEEIEYIMQYSYKQIIHPGNMENYYSYKDHILNSCEKCKLVKKEDLIFRFEKSNQEILSYERLKLLLISIDFSSENPAGNHVIIFDVCNEEREGLILFVRNGIINQCFTDQKFLKNYLFLKREPITFELSDEQIKSSINILINSEIMVKANELISNFNLNIIDDLMFN